MIITKIRHILIFVFIVFICASYFYKDGYKSISDVNRDVIATPVQTPVANQKTINFEKGGFSYTLTTVQDYTITGLVLHTQNYDAWYSLSRTDKTFSKDICVVWGKTLQSKSYQSLDVTQDSHWCWWNYYKPGLVVNSDEISNNHLITSSQSVEKQILSIGGGDQIRIFGKLVNVHASALGQAHEFEPQQADWFTSTSRNDSGAGACEIIYVERVDILKSGHSISRFFYSAGWYGLYIVLIWSLVNFIVSLKSKNI